MPPLSESDILAVWRALGGSASDTGWRSIDLVQAGMCRIKAARHAPGNEEAVLVGFATAKISPSSQLPNAQGFRIDRTELGAVGDGYQWLAIVRQPIGSLELFATVVNDIVRLLQSSSTCAEDVLYQLFLGRVRGWQEFMRKGREGLSAEAELGLFGELLFLQEVVGSGVLVYTAVDAWKGPHDGLHDFQFGSGAIEIKSTLAVEGFPIKVGSLDQLDDLQSSALYLNAMRFSLSEKGVSLPQLVRQLRELFFHDAASSRLFELAVHEAGYLDLHSEFYTRRFKLGELRINLVDSAFPKIVPHMLSPAVRYAQYELNLSLFEAESYSLVKVLESFGVI